MNDNNQMNRSLKNRHIQMIALGGAIGTGLFYGSGATIKMAGPAVSLSYLIGGIIIFLIMRMLGEMSVEDPQSGSFAYFANKYWGPFPGFLAGWSYYITYGIASMAELTAVGIYMNFWFPDLPQWVSALICLVVITLINLVTVRLFGEIEFGISFIKIIAIIAMIVFGTIILFADSSYGSFPQNFGNLWMNGGYMPNGWWGLAMSIVIAMFSFGGVELIGVTAGESETPEKSIPKATNEVLLRILIFYVGTMIVLLALYPWDQIGQHGSPFVLIFEYIGIPAAAHLLNIVVLAAAISVYNSALYVNSRILYSMAGDHHAPAFFKNLTAHQVPYMGVIFTSGLTALTVILNYLFPSKVFMYLVAFTVAALIIIWTAIVLTHMKFREKKVAEGTVVSLKFKSLWYPFSNYICLAFMAALVIVMYQIPDMDLAVYFIPITIICMYIIFKLSHQKG